MTRKTLADVVGASGGSAEAGFLGLPQCDPGDGAQADIAVLGAATATPYPQAGAYCSDGPDALRAASRAAAATVRNMDFDLGGPLLADGVAAVDCGDVPVELSPATPQARAANRARVTDAVEKLAARDAVPVVLGGDDSVPIPVAAGLAVAGQPLSVLQIDAHIDWRDTVGTERMGLSSTMRRISQMPHIGQIVQVGCRGAGSASMGDVQDALAHGVHFEGARGLDLAAIRRAVSALPADGRVLICFDADALDPSIMPAVIGRVPGGLSYWQALDLLEACTDRCRIAGLCFTEFMPSADVDGLGALTATRILTNAIGRIARQVAARQGPLSFQGHDE